MDLNIFQKRTPQVHNWRILLLSACPPVPRALKAGTTPSTWPQSPWWPPTAPYGTPLSQSQRISWSTCSLASSSSGRSRKPSACLWTCTSWTRGGRVIDRTYVHPSLLSFFTHPSFIHSSFIFYSLLLCSFRVTCTWLYSQCLHLCNTYWLYIHTHTERGRVLLYRGITSQPPPLLFLPKDVVVKSFFIGPELI